MASQTSLVESSKLSMRHLIYLIIGLFVGAVFWANMLATDADFITTFTIFTTRFLGIFIEAVPFLLLGTLTSGLIEAFVSHEDIARFVPKNKLGATIGGAFLGVIFPVCECGVVPVARRLFTKGLPMSVGITFLLAAPFMNPIVFVSTYIAFGWGPVLIGRFIITALVAIGIGLIFAYMAKPEEVLLPQSMCVPNDEQPRKRGRNLRKGFSQALNIAGNEFFEMGRFLIMGCLLAAALQTVVPQDVLLSIGEGPIVSVIVLQILAFVLSVCSTVDAFLALAFTNTFTTGAILGFLSFGPMVDIKSTIMFTGVFQKKVVAYLIVLPFALNLLAGVIVNMILGG